MTFSLNQYMTDLVVSSGDEELGKSNDLVNLIQAICEDKWLSRQAHFGLAGAMERQIEYLGTTLLPNAEEKLTRMASEGVMGESYTIDSWFNTSNEDDPHINDEIPFDQIIDDQQTFVDELKNRMRTAAIVFATNVKAHDDLSKELNQLTYVGIKAKANANRQVAKTG